MRGLISTITTIAAAIHFTFGCCLHLPHGEAAVGCCPYAAAHHCGEACADDGCHDRGSVEEVHDDTRGHGVHRSVARDAGHDCDGCHCAATTDGSIDDSLSLSVDRVGVPAAPPLGMIGAGRGCRETRARDPVASAIRPPLFERLTL
jgi:hypothetical protein